MESSSLSDELPFEDERDATPVANYLERLIVPVSTTSTVGKSSFSPFGKLGNKPKGQTSSSDIWYKPPAPMKSSSFSDELSSEEERDATPIAVGNYLEGLMVPLNVVSATIKNAWSPFGMKSTKSSSDTSTLYSPQSVADEYALMEKELKIETKKRELDYIDPKQSSYGSIDMIMEATEDDNSISTEEKMLGPDNNLSFESSKTGNEEENNFDYLPESPEEASLPETLDHTPSKNVPHESHEYISDTGKSSISNLSTAESDKIGATYIDWCDNFNKESSDFRFEIFSAHYMATENFHKENGIPLMLNEFSDFTEEEYKTMINEVVDNNVIDPVVEERIVSAYKQWCDWYDKNFSQDRLKIFASNFLMLERYHCGKTGTSLMCFNEYSDLTEEEFDALNEKR